MTRSAPEPSQWVQSLCTYGDVRAHLGWEAAPEVPGHVTVLEPTLTERQGPVLQDTWRHVRACSTPYLDLKLVRRGTRSAGYRHLVWIGWRALTHRERGLPYRARQS
jgi:hypothetical protein